MWQLGDCKMFKLQFIGKDPITVGAIHESPAVPKRPSVRMFFIIGAIRESPLQPIQTSRQPQIRSIFNRLSPPRGAASQGVGGIGQQEPKTNACLPRERGVETSAFEMVLSPFPKLFGPETPLKNSPHLPVFVILPISHPSSPSIHVKFHKNHKISQKPLTQKESCGIMASPLRRAFLLCPKSCATRRTRAPGEGGTRQSYFRETANNFYGRCRYHG